MTMTVQISPFSEKTHRLSFAEWNAFANIETISCQKIFATFALKRLLRCARNDYKTKIPLITERDVL